MAANLLDGKTLAEKLKAEIIEDVKNFSAQHGFVPGVAVVLVGEDPASKVYAKRIGKSFEDVGMTCQQVILPETISEAELRAEITKLNNDVKTSGIIVQLPLPKPLTQDMVTDVMSPLKDVDGIHPVNAGRLYLGQEGFVPNTPHGGLELLKRYGVEIKGANAVIVGRSNIVGKPMAMLLLQENATVTVCHSRTKDLPAVTREADILVAAIGQPKMIKGSWIKPGAAVVDFGINPAEKGIVGDVDFDEAKDIAAWITPVPGGTGPMTNIMLQRNTLKAARLNLAKS